jgi:hypothetical protein
MLKNMVVSARNKIREFVRYVRFRWRVRALKRKDPFIY